MEYLSVAELAAKWDISERTVRNYCAAGKISGAVLKGKTWIIPADAKMPVRGKKSVAPCRSLLDVLKEEKSGKTKGGLYHKIQIDFTYNSNHMEGSKLTHDQTRFIYETCTIGLAEGTVNVDDIVETANHFRCIDMIIDAANRPLSESFIKALHQTLKNGTMDSRKEWFAVGAYKKVPNEVGGMPTTPPEQVAAEIQAIIASYNRQKVHTLTELLEFHVAFEKIHPFQDGNGRVGRLILFKECLHNHIVPFIIDENLRLFYYRGLREWENERGYLTDTCLAAQDKFKKYLEYFRVVVDPGLSV